MRKRIMLNRKLFIRTRHNCDVPATRNVVNDNFSLMPAPQLAQKQVRIVARTIDIVQDSTTADFAGIVDHDVTKTQNSLHDR